MSLKGMDGRIERFERRMHKKFGCDGCNRTLYKRQLMKAADEPVYGEHWDSTDLARCPDCGSPNPKYSVLFVQTLVLGADEIQEMIDSRQGLTREAIYGSYEPDDQIQILLDLGERRSRRIWPGM